MLLRWLLLPLPLSRQLQPPHNNLPHQATNSLCHSMTGHLHRLRRRIKYRLCRLKGALTPRHLQQPHTSLQQGVGILEVVPQHLTTLRQLLPHGTLVGPPQPMALRVRPILSRQLLQPHSTLRAITEPIGPHHLTTKLGSNKLVHQLSLAMIPVSGLALVGEEEQQEQHHNNPHYPLPSTPTTIRAQVLLQHQTILLPPRGIFPLTLPGALPRPSHVHLVNRDKTLMDSIFSHVIVLL